MLPNPFGPQQATKRSSHGSGNPHYLSILMSILPCRPSQGPCLASSCLVKVWYTLKFSPSWASSLSSFSHKMSSFVLFEKMSVIYTPSLAKTEACATEKKGVMPEPPAHKKIFVFGLSSFFFKRILPKPRYLIFPIGPSHMIESPTFTFYSHHFVYTPPLGYSSVGL